MKSQAANSQYHPIVESLWQNPSKCRTDPEKALSLLFDPCCSWLADPVCLALTSLLLSTTPAGLVKEEEEGLVGGRQDVLLLLKLAGNFQLPKFVDRFWNLQLLQTERSQDRIPSLRAADPSATTIYRLHGVATRIGLSYPEIPQQPPRGENNDDNKEEEGSEENNKHDENSGDSGSNGSTDIDEVAPGSGSRRARGKKKKEVGTTREQPASSTKEKTMRNSSDPPSASDVSSASTMMITDDGTLLWSHAFGADIDVQSWRNSTKLSREFSSHCEKVLKYGWSLGGGGVNLASSSSSTGNSPVKKSSSSGRKGSSVSSLSRKASVTRVTSSRNLRRLASTSGSDDSPTKSSNSKRKEYLLRETFWLGSRSSNEFSGGGETAVDTASSSSCMPYLDIAVAGAFGILPPFDICQKMAQCVMSAAVSSYDDDSSDEEAPHNMVNGHPSSSERNSQKKRIARQRALQLLGATAKTKKSGTTESVQQLLGNGGQDHGNPLFPYLSGVAFEDGWKDVFYLVLRCVYDTISLTNDQLEEMLMMKVDETTTTVAGKSGGSSRSTLASTKTTTTTNGGEPRRRSRRMMMLDSNSKRFELPSLEMPTEFHREQPGAHWNLLPMVLEKRDPFFANTLKSFYQEEFTEEYWDTLRMSPFCYCWRRLEVVKWLYEECGLSVTKLEPSGTASCIFAAAENGNLEVLKYLRSQGCKMMPYLFGESPLHFAARQDQLEIVKFYHQVVLRKKKQIKTVSELVRAELSLTNNNNNNNNGKEKQQTVEEGASSLTTSNTSEEKEVSRNEELFYFDYEDLQWHCPRDGRVHQYLVKHCCDGKDMYPEW